MSPEREKAIKKHFDKTIKEFKKKALKIALENDYPYIEGLLDRLLIHMDHNIQWSKANICPNEIKFALENLE